MKREQLLEAVGGVDESLLMESETAVSRRRLSFGRTALIAAIVAALAMTAAAASQLFFGLQEGGNGATIENLATGMGTFVYSDGYIYEGTTGCIKKYETTGKLLERIQLGDEKAIPRYMFATEDAIVYIDTFSGLYVQPKDGAKTETVFDDMRMTMVYADGAQLYTTDGADMLTRIDLMTMEKTELLQDVISYYVDDTHIYAVQSGRGKYYMRSPKDVIAFEKIELDFDPNKVVVNGEDLYFCEWVDEEARDEEAQRYRVNLVRDGVRTQLPVYSWFYQILDHFVLYLEEGSNALKCYDLHTGQTKLLEDNVFEFSILEKRYICIDLMSTASVILDWQTGERVQLPE